jgi:hypothetical protein
MRPVGGCLSNLSRRPGRQPIFVAVHRLPIPKASWALSPVRILFVIEKQLGLSKTHALIATGVRACNTRILFLNVTQVFGMRNGSHERHRRISVLVFARRGAVKATEGIVTIISSTQD